MSWWMGLWATAAVLIVSAMLPARQDASDPKAAAGSGATPKPRIRKLGTIDCDTVETTPFVFAGKLIIDYSWGNQRGVEHLAEAVYDGGLAGFLRGFFPQKSR